MIIQFFVNVIQSVSWEQYNHEALLFQFESHRKIELTMNAISRLGILLLSMLGISSGLKNRSTATVWHLTAAAELIEDLKAPFDQQEIRAWLRHDGSNLHHQARQTAGLELTLVGNEEFRERCIGKPKIMWFDADGVQTQFGSPEKLTEAKTFAGILLKNETGTYLLPQEKLAPLHRPNSDTDQPLLRCNDGDTQISDAIYIESNDRLRRVINVITDEAYGTRVVLIYQKQP